MAVVQDFVSATITLATSSIPSASYDQMFLCDSTDVPVHARYLSTTKSGYATDLTSTENTYKFAQAFWGQSRTPDTLVLGRWISAATSPYYVCGDYETDYTVWAAVTDGSFKVTDNAGTPNIDSLTAINFSTATSFANVITILNTALAALVTPNITGLDSATFSLDNLGNLILTHNSVTGAAAATLTIISDTTGTDLSGSAYFDAGATGTDGMTIPGYDVEEPTAAVTAIRAKNGGDDWYDMCIRGESTTQQQALAAQFESLRKQLTLVSTEAGAKSAASTTDVPYLLNALGYDRTMIMYTEHTITATGGWCDAAIQGACLPADEGSLMWHKTVVAGVYQSGKEIDNSPKALTTTERTALEGKECNYFVTIGNDTWMEEGHTVGGNEKHIVLGADWLANSIETETLTYMLNNDIVAFDDPTLTAIEKIIRKYLTEAGPKGRKFLLDTRAYPITITMPTADDFDSTDRATHTLTLSQVFSAYANSTANKIVITGEIRG